MIRKMLQSVLCMILSPLLAAQQVTQSSALDTSAQNAISSNSSPTFVTLTKGTEIKLISLDAISSATTKAGTNIRFRVDQDVVVQSMTVIRAGTLLTGTITKVVAGSRKRHRDGQIRLHIDNLHMAGGQTIRFTGLSPSAQFERKQNRKFAAKDLLWLPLAMRDEGGTPEGNDIQLPQCFQASAYTARQVKVRTADLNQGAAFHTSNDASVCRLGNGISALHIDGFQIQ
jgi:hypothetical protein